MKTKEKQRLSTRSFKSLLLSLAFVGAATHFSCAQTMEIDWVQISGSDVVVHYTLEDDNPLHAYTINLFSSQDNFAAPLLKLEGDHGNEIKPGKDKQIRWHVTEEIGQFAGEIELEIRGKMYVPFMKMTEFQSAIKYKRGKNYPLVWRTGNPGGQVDIELYYENTRISSDRNVPNSGKFDWLIPGNARPGTGYRLKFTNVKSREETFFTEPFTIVNKIPLAAKIAGGAVLGAGIFILTRGRNGNNNTSTETEPDLPDFNTTPTQH